MTEFNTKITYYEQGKLAVGRTAKAHFKFYAAQYFSRLADRMRDSG